MFKILILILIYTINVVKSDMYLIYEENEEGSHLKCVVDADHPGIYFNTCGFASISEYQNSQTVIDFENEDVDWLNKSNNWKIDIYPNKNYEWKPVVDYRWEQFLPVEDLNDILDYENEDLKFSMINCGYDGVKNKSSQKTDKNCVTLPINEWVRAEMENETLERAEKCNGVKAKQETYKYLWTDKNDSKLLIPVINEFSFQCISFYTAMCFRCTLFVEIYDNVTGNFITDESFDTFNEAQWETKKLCYTTELPPDINIVFITSAKTEGEIFWAIDDLRMSKEKDKRVLKMEGANELLSISCYSIDPTSDRISMVSTTDLKQCKSNIAKYCDNSTKCIACYREKDKVRCCENFGNATVTTEFITTTTSQISTTEYSDIIEDTVTTMNFTFTTTELSSENKTSNSSKTNEEKTSSANFTYLYLLFFLIPISCVAIAVFRHLRKKKKLRKQKEKKAAESEQLTSPDWLFKEPEYNDKNENYDEHRE